MSPVSPRSLQPAPDAVSPGLTAENASLQEQLSSGQQAATDAHTASARKIDSLQAEVKLLQEQLADAHYRADELHMSRTQVEELQVERAALQQQLAEAQQALRDAEAARSEGAAAGDRAAVAALDEVQRLSSEVKSLQVCAPGLQWLTTVLAYQNMHSDLLAHRLSVFETVSTMVDAPSCQVLISSSLCAIQCWLQMDASGLSLDCTGWPTSGGGPSSD